MIAPSYSMAEVARMCNVHESTPWRWSLQGVKGCRLATYRVGGRRRVFASELALFLERLNQGLSEQSCLTGGAAEASDDVAEELSRLGV